MIIKGILSLINLQLRQLDSPKERIYFFQIPTLTNFNIFTAIKIMSSLINTKPVDNRRVKQGDFTLLQGLEVFLYFFHMFLKQFLN